MRFILSLAKVTIKGSSTEKIYYLLLLATILTFFLTPYFATLSPRQGKQVALDFILATQSFIGLVIAVFVGSGLIAKDIDKKLIYSVITKPATRTEYLMGRFVGMGSVLFTALVITAVFGMATYYATLSFFPTLGEEPHWGIYWLSVFFLYMKLLIIVAVAFLFSAVATSTLFPLAITIGVYIAGVSAVKVKSYFEAASGQHWGEGFKLLVSTGFYLLPNLAAFDLKAQAAYGLPVQGMALAWVALYGLAYIFMILSLTAIVFEKRDLV